VAVTVGTHRSEFSYDGQQRRVHAIEKENSVVQSDTTLIWCQSEICERRSFDGSTILRRAFGQGEQVAAVMMFYATDHLGSVRDVTDASAGVLARYEFDPWGRRELVSGLDLADRGFTGHDWLPTVQLSETWYRGYDPALGRWISQDPAGFVDGANLYEYVRNAPLRFIDQSGLQLHTYTPPPGAPPAGCSAGPWSPTGRGVLSREAMVNWVLVRIETVRVPTIRNPRGFVASCTCVFEARGVVEVVTTYEDFERQVTCCESTYTESRRTTQRSEHLIPSISSFPPRRYYSRGIPVGSKCLCANPPRW
jgi:RHS repeat-associated protein